MKLTIEYSATDCFSWINANHPSFAWAIFANDAVALPLIAHKLDIKIRFLWYKQSKADKKT